MVSEPTDKVQAAEVGRGRLRLPTEEKGDSSYQSVENRHQTSQPGRDRRHVRRLSPVLRDQPAAAAAAPHQVALPDFAHHRPPGLCSEAPTRESEWRARARDTPGCSPGERAGASRPLSPQSARTVALLVQHWYERGEGASVNQS